MKKPIVKLDGDGVLIDIHTPWLEVYNAISGDDLHLAEITRWEAHQLVRPEWQAYYYRMRFPWLYDYAQPLPGAQDGVRALARKGYHLVALTHDYPSHLPAKARALRRLFPELEHIVFAEDKWQVIPDGLLVDDAAHNRPNILLTQPWNAGHELAGGQFRAGTWTEVVDLIDLIHYIHHPRRPLWAPAA